MRLHLSTLLIVMIASALLLGLNMRRQSSLLDGIAKFLPNEIADPCQSMGWPWAYYNTIIEPKNGRMTPDGDVSFELSTTEKLNVTAVASDAVVCIGILILLAGVCEKIARKCPPWRISRSGPQSNPAPESHTSALK